VSLQRYLPHTRESAEETKKRAFREYGMLVASVDDPRLDWVQRETLKQVGTKLYGKPKERRDGKHHSQPHP